ncbi:hypothetical protein C5746_30005 [Streptomyces atratus]|uniref:Uncharacterized protein n=2 Tax=Streptomyces TaxID=1883 RepID=A0A2Z5JJE2_STRAR|nr:hypothetical protein C5746_30005 [Streptomyces atratus]
MHGGDGADDQIGIGAQRPEMMALDQPVLDRLQGELVPADFVVEPIRAADDPQTSCRSVEIVRPDPGSSWSTSLTGAAPLHCVGEPAGRGRRCSGMVLMLAVSLLMASVIVVPLVLSGARRLVLRTGRPRWLRRLVGKLTTGGGGSGAGAAVADELAAVLNPNKRVEIEQRRTEQLVRHDSEAGAPPHVTGVDLTTGRAVIRRR